MEPKDVTAVALIAMALPVVVAAACTSPRVRDIAMFLVTFGCALSGKLDVSLDSRMWYRGTSRGIDLSWVDVLALGVTLSLLLRPRKGQARWFLVAGTLPFVLYWLYCVLSVTISTPKLFGVYELAKALSGFNVLVATALFLRSERDLRIILWAVMLAVSYHGLWAVKCRYVDHLFRIQGTFSHPNMLAMYMCSTVPVAVAATVSNLPVRLRQCALLAAVVGSVSCLMTVSRTGMATLLVLMFGLTVAFATFKITLKRMAVSILVLGCTLGAVGKVWDTMTARFGEATMDQEYGGTGYEGRGSYLRLAKLMVHDHSLGVGLNLWSYYATNVYCPKLGMPTNPYNGTEIPPDTRWIYGSKELPQAAPAHSLGAITLGELGWPGLFLFAILWARWFHVAGSFLWPRSAVPTRRIPVGIFFGLCGVFLMSLTEYAYRNTELLLTTSMLIGTAAGLYQLRRTERSARAGRPEDHSRPSQARPPVRVVARRRDLGP